MAKQKKIVEPIFKNEFSIFQFEKTEGIRQGKIKYKEERFVSPIFGTNVKDDITVPFEVKPTGDTIKKFDAFRTVKKLTPEEAVLKYGSKYYEFTNLVNNEKRTLVLGGKPYLHKDENKKEEETIKDEAKVKPISKGPIDSLFEEEKEEPVLTKEKPTVVTLDPILEEKNIKDDEPSITTFVRPRYDSSKVVSGNFTADDSDELKVKENITQKKVNITLDKENKKYVLPQVSLFAKKDRDTNEKPEWLLNQIEVINNTLAQFGIEGEVNGSKKGPTVTRYEIALEPGVNVKRISNIQDNLMMNLASKSVRIEAPIPGKPYVGLEVPNAVPEIVAFGNVVDTKEFLYDQEHPLKVALGVDIDGENIYIDIASMPHGLIAGATNSGKSVCVNSILVSLLIKNRPEDLRLILIDPKMVELTPYNDLPHLITPVITDAKMAAAALNWAVNEMEKRYHTFASSRSRDIKSFNDQVKRGIIEETKMPYIVIIIDELADLMAVSSHEVEDLIQRITQKARAAGIHLLVATQRPTTDVVKGTIKSNIPVRMAFKVASFVDSTTILDGAGAESLLGKGDMLLKKSDRAFRLQGAYIPDNEIYAVTDYLRECSTPQYDLLHEDLRSQVKLSEIASDDLFNDVAYFVVESGLASINVIQKEFEIGFNRAQKLVEMLESYGIVSENQKNKAREVLVGINQLKEILGH